MASTTATAQTWATVQPIVVSVPEAARLIGMGKTKLWELIWAGKFPHVREGRWVGVRLAAIEEWAQQVER